MRRLALSALLAALAAAPAAHAAAPVDPTPPLRAALTDCVAGSALFTGSMPATRATRRMAMRFDLQVRRGTGRWHGVRVPGWGVWQRSHARVPGFIVTKTIGGLVAPAAYRARVRFRWYDAHGRVVHHATRTSRSCAQHDRRPDLVPGSLRADAGGRYLVEVRNAGASDAGPFAVAVTAGGGTASATVAGLAAGTARTVAVAGPPCTTGTAVHVAVDGADAVDEVDETDNTATRACPL